MIVFGYQADDLIQDFGLKALYRSFLNNSSFTLRWTMLAKKDYQKFIKSFFNIKFYIKNGQLFKIRVLRLK